MIVREVPAAASDGAGARLAGNLRARVQESWHCVALHEAI